MTRSAITEIAGHAVHRFEAIPSTNDLLMAMVKESDVVDGTVVVAGEQTAGRGRQGRTWVAMPGSGLLFSVYLSRLNPSIAYAVPCLALLHTVRSLTDRASAIKWPNDVQIEERKVAGILLDQLSDGIIAGIGINVNTGPEEIARIGHHATSLLVATGRRFDLDPLLGNVLAHLDHWYRVSIDSPEFVFAEWKAALNTLGRDVEVVTAKGEWKGRAVDVASDGSLLVTKDKRVVAVHAADVRLAVVT